MAKLKVGILGGGQLARLMLEVAPRDLVETFVLDSDPEPTAGLVDHFIRGSFRDEATVSNFAQLVDVLTIEIEDVSIAALKKIEAAGKRVIPPPRTLETIQDKRLQKEFFAAHNLKSPEFILVDGPDAIAAAAWEFPFVWKLARGGYDGRGVRVIHSPEAIHELPNLPAVIERKLELAHELAVIIARNAEGTLLDFPVVEMRMNGELHQLDVLLSPANLPEAILEAARNLARNCALAFSAVGLLAVEMFVDQAGIVYLNEVAPRPHNSGHHTIEANQSSQFQVLWRVLLEQPLGSAKSIASSLMKNIVGPPEITGSYRFQGIEDVRRQPGIYVHTYGKLSTKPGRKLGHITAIGPDLPAVEARMREAEKKLQVVARDS